MTCPFSCCRCRSNKFGTSWNGQNDPVGQRRCDDHQRRRHYSQTNVGHPSGIENGSFVSFDGEGLRHVFVFQLVELSKAQDIEAGDGTTTVVVLAGSLLDAASRLVAKGSSKKRRQENRFSTFVRSFAGLHPTTIADAFEKAADKATEILRSISIPIQLNDNDALQRSASTALNSKVKALRFVSIRSQRNAFRSSLNTRICWRRSPFKPFSK